MGSARSGASAAPARPSLRPGMGALPHSDGVTFRVWAPHAQAVSVAGTFNEWAAEGIGLARDPVGGGARAAKARWSGTWSAGVPGGNVGAEDRYLIPTSAG